MAFIPFASSDLASGIEQRTHTYTDAHVRAFVVRNNALNARRFVFSKRCAREFCNYVQTAIDGKHAVLLIQVRIVSEMIRSCRIVIGGVGKGVGGWG